MYRVYDKPVRSHFDTEEEYLEACEAYDREEELRAEYYIEQQMERRCASN